MVPGLVHMGDEVRRVGKPYVNFMFVIGPYMSNYYEAAAKDKVQLGDPAKGEVMISEGASDYVPPTKMEDWPWPYHQTTAYKDGGLGVALPGKKK